MSQVDEDEVIEGQGMEFCTWKGPIYDQHSKEFHPLYYHTQDSRSLTCSIPHPMSPTMPRPRLRVRHLRNSHREEEEVRQKNLEDNPSADLLARVALPEGILFVG
jgi:hypothetical protein